MSTALRFCLATTFYPPYHFGGDAIFVYRLARALVEAGHQVDVIHSVDAHAITGARPQNSFPELPGVRRLPLKSGMARLNTLLAHQAGNPGPYHAELYKLLDNDRYDIIHFHNISLLGAPGVLRYGRCAKLYTTHEYWLICPTHVLFKYGSHACEEKHCLSCTLQTRRPPQLWRFSAHLQSCLAHVDRLLIPSQFALNKHRSEGITAAMTLLPSFVPVPEHLPDVAPQERPYFLFVGRLEKLKGVQDILPVMRHFPNARLVIAGAGTYADHLHKLAHDLPNVEFLGAVHPDQIANLYRGATAVVVPSLCFEVFPLAPVEALAYGVPVIARRIGAITEVIEQSGGGLLFESQEECRALMEQLLRDATLRQQLGEKGRHQALCEWTQEIHMNRYLSIVDETLENHKHV